jgi:hypothetical protein
VVAYACNNPKGEIMPLVSMAHSAVLDDAEEGVLFTMQDSSQSVSILVSRHALEDICPQAHGGGDLERFNEYRVQFEEIASDKYDKGHLERDGSVCIRGRDLPGKGH